MEKKVYLKWELYKAPVKWKGQAFLLVFALFFINVQINAQVTYHLGNSLTDTNNTLLPLISQSAGKNHTYLRSTIPGAPTDWVWGNGYPNPNATPPYAGPNGERDYRVVFSNNVLDHLFTQPFASHCRSIENEADYSGRFFNLARQNSPNVQHWLYMQWPTLTYEDCWSRGEGGVDGTAATNYIQAVCNHRIYFEKVRTLMDSQQPGKSIRIMPSGLALAKLKIEIDAGRGAGLTFNSLFGDDLHLNEKGQYLISLTLYVGIYGETPEGRVTYKPSGLTEDQASLMRRIAWNVVSDYPWSGLGGSGTLTNEICNGGGGGPDPDPDPVTVSGDVERELWSNVTGTSVSAIPVNTTPTSKSTLTSLEGPTNAGDNYGARIRGYIVPTVEGWYRLYIAADDDAELWFSSGSEPADKSKVASVTGWTASRQWDKYPSQKSSEVYLVSGGKFYFEVLHKEGNGGDNVAVGWTGPGITTPTVIGSANLDKFITNTTNLRDPENPTNTVAGLEYKYFEGTWTTLPNFDALTAAETGNVTNFDMSVRNRTDNYGFKYTGYINITTEGTYTFYTSSDDGSKLYIGTTEVVSNDGLHATQERSGTIGLKAGKHAITVTFFEAGGGEVLTVSYAGPDITKTAIPASALFRNGTSTGTLTKATGTTFGTAPWTNCTTCTPDKVFDGNTATYFDANNADGAYAGIDAGTARVITRIRYYPRSTNLERMTGGKFQGSNTSSSSGFVDLYTVPSQPTNAWQQVDIQNMTGYRYLRYLSPNGGYGNVAEVEFYYNSNSTARTMGNEVEAEQPLEKMVKAYPNPSSDNLTVEYHLESDQQVQISMTNSLSYQLVKIIRDAKKGKNTEVINVSGYKPGIYFISIIKKAGAVTEKVMISK